MSYLERIELRLPVEKEKASTPTSMSKQQKSYSPMFFAAMSP